MPELSFVLTDPVNNTPPIKIEADDVEGRVRIIWPSPDGDWKAVSLRPDGSRWIINTQIVPADAPFERTEDGHVLVTEG